MPDTVDTNAKALRINLDHSAYGTIAEIGGGQEVARWFFRVGGAAGTVAKTMSAYDMAVSDAIYGGGTRYVSRERVASMLEHEYALLIERLGSTRGDKAAFFTFADTVATRSFKGGNECHGWLGLRFQHQIGAAPSDILLHVELLDPTAELQQQSLGVLGVNLIYAAYYQRASFTELVKSLVDGLSMANIEIDVIDCSGPAFEAQTDQRAVAMEMLACGLTHAVVFDECGRMEQPSTVFRKRALLIHRCSRYRENPQLDAMLRESVALFRTEGIGCEREPLLLLELAATTNAAERAESKDKVHARIDRVFRPGYATVLTSFAETFRVSTFLRRYSPEPIRFVFGLDTMINVLRDSFYTGKLDGGLLEALGRLLAPNTKLYVFPMPAEVLREQLALRKIEPEFWNAPDKAVLGVDDISLTPPAGHLLDFLKSAGWVKSAGT